jgi:hypothetical protein
MMRGKGVPQSESLLDIAAAAAMDNGNEGAR